MTNVILDVLFTHVTIIKYTYFTYWPNGTLGGMNQVIFGIFSSSKCISIWLFFSCFYMFIDVSKASREFACLEYFLEEWTWGNQDYFASLHLRPRRWSIFRAMRCQWFIFQQRCDTDYFLEKLNIAIVALIFLDHRERFFRLFCIL